MKYKLLIVDDEPLVQVGIKSMLKWEDLNIEICGTAVNGSVALEMIETHKPDIVLTDIKMPVMDGISMLKNYREKTSDALPVFIMLTSYEEFSLAKQALSLQAFEYLVKVELTPESLSDTIKRAISKIEEANASKAPQNSQQTKSSSLMMHSFTEKFMISLLNNLFESRDQLLLQAEDLHMSLNYQNYICCYGSFEAVGTSGMSKELFSLYDSALSMVRELAEKYQTCHIISLDISHFALLFCFAGETDNASLPMLSDMLTRITNSLKNYMGILMRCGIGTVVSDPLNICSSYQHSRLSYRQTDNTNPVKFVESDFVSPHDTFHFSLFQKELTRAYEEFNSTLLCETISSLCELLQSHPNHYVQALDAASNILYMSISLLPEGEKTVAEFFSNHTDGYMSLYHQTTTPQIINWLDYLTEKLSSFFDERKKDYKNKIVSDVKAYIDEHITEKLSLNEVAAQFGISPSYLSQLFSRYNETGFSEHINICKINAAKQMLREENSRVYEVADALSFGSEFYFSKVFKKVEGISPTEYINGSHT